MRANRKKRWLAAGLCISLLFSITGCGNQKETSENQEVLDGTGMDENQVEPGTESGSNQENTGDSTGKGDTMVQEEQLPETINLMEGIESLGLDMTDELPDVPIMKFGLPLFQNVLKEAKEGENVLVSPLSAITALYMTYFGAEGDTGKQMGNVLGKGMESYLNDYATNLPQGEAYKVNLANGIWFKNVPQLHVKEKFLQYNKNFFQASAYQAPFNNDTLEEINAWVTEQTDGMITQILDEITERDVIFLINALSFDAEWQNIYQQHEVWNDIFTTESGEEQLVSMLHSNEQLYLEDELATGFVKYYKDQKYAFVALLPKDGVSVAEYVEGLTAEHLKELLCNPEHATVEVTLPKFTTEYSVTLNEILTRMGMPDAFSETDADFSRMATYDNANIYISKVLQKTFISVDERGTRAGAATAVAMANKLMIRDTKVVNLNRPFVYLLVECEHNEPLFIGTLMDVEQ